MASYIYKARDDHGKSFNGHLKAENTTLARAKLRQAGYYPIRIVPEHQLGIKQLLEKINPIGLDDLVVFCQQFSSMIHSGLPILHALDVIWKQTENKKFQVVVSRIRSELSEGSSLYDAVRKYPGIFPAIFINLIRVGEISGTLDKTLQKLVVYFTKEYELRQRIKSAFTYPIIVVSVAIAVVAFMVTAVIPVFSRVFTRIAVSSALPLPTVILLYLSEFARRLWWTLPLFLLVATMLLKKVKQTRHGSYLLDRIKLKLPLFGKLIHKVAISRFVRALGIIIAEGITMVQALRVTYEISGNQVIKKAILDSEKRIMAGSNLHLPLSESGLFPDIVIQMISTGEEAGTLDEMLISAADQLDQEIDYKVKKLTVALEPLLTIVLGIIVGFIAISLYLPIFDMVKFMR